MGITADVIVIGAGMAGLSAAIYLGRARRNTVVIDSGKSMARWEPDVQNYLGFPKGVGGEELLQRGRRQARRYGIRFVRDEILEGRSPRPGAFRLKGRAGRYSCRRLLLATGIFHIPPDIPDVKSCLGHSLFFCKDCDGYRVQGKEIAIYGWTNEAVEYALGMILYTPYVAIVTDGRQPRWDAQHEKWVAEYEIPVYRQEILQVARRGSKLEALEFGDGKRLMVAAVFTTRGDVYLNKVARSLKARLNPEGDIIVDAKMRTSVAGLYAAGCVTPANCQMIIAAGEGAIAAQAINRDLFEESLATHSLRRLRGRQLIMEKTLPALKRGVS